MFVHFLDQKNGRNISVHKSQRNAKMSDFYFNLRYLLLNVKLV